ncbi:hypothetical protein A2331_03370 [Candidatus Falkowbacteria bacterium RIFOXYB2_FULL_34_18]|uniref:SGNH hydrolase-type esterase domain-containing protein n=1 Tax=Candidatus Falkowbacteria bacterium RIFOXYD2_FULL_34_120 TaxID=1798007 RepID=A0A1F5TP02_9BACT|nr:MAG: hypothetical protein A2331_03370 [Candidatus Falkowbacteria bacterium RIFOXYB2_FULL_34_18]OGF28940.1 MAG: hypothetical protein A2500_01690 [Candidatus Falkowbacteria bacterium RIFOXYC12_FULL_34_55]OGF35861.1 MAG: hypothetical protein A2466_03690 [Candidatus Falkowbacteria bacterium RIFOXYC2_FULL_34_220]OGF38468.1 MAG: hypothetical protein A2515_07060 [Candidatus Falkowbacteria bacterium RIFOXYD12_FULL_34_57]OGF40534.1 MAG: hypothetical protein A2531_04475 [Candidatus Falkowbacteria bact
MNKQLQKIENKLKQGDWYRIAFLGDSITSTEWVHPNWREVIEYVLKMELEIAMGEWELPWWKLRCLNAGYNGASTSELMKFVEKDVIPCKPNLAIFMDTYNDKYKNINPDEHAKNLDIILSKLTVGVGDVVFSNSIARFNEKANMENKKYIATAETVVKKYKNKIRVVDMYSAFSQLELDKFFTFKYTKDDIDAIAGIKVGDIDFGHPNSLGNAYVAKIMLKEIFGLDFNPDRYIDDSLAGKKYPGY